LDPGLFNISGSLSKNTIDNKILLVVAFGNLTGENLLVTPNAVIACDENINPPCPINSGVQFHMDQVLFPVPTDLTSISSYVIIISMGVLVNNSLDVYSCAYANFTF
ncbi:23223_t:CDS:1, partial [Gigaspora margarita]